MAAPEGFEVDPHEALGLRVRERPARPAFDGAPCLGLEFTSRGDRVPGRLLLPRGGGDAPAPVVLLGHELGGRTESETVDACAPWLRGGAAVASIDLPLHGARSSAKLSEHLLASADPTGATGGAAAGEAADRGRLWLEFTRQAVLDLRRSVDALVQTRRVDASRLAFAGFGLGALLGAVFCAHDPRPRAAALALGPGPGGASLGPSGVDPCRSIGRIAPRPLLLLDAGGGADAAKALYAAAGEPREQRRLDARPEDWPGAAAAAMWDFLRGQLGLS